MKPYLTILIADEIPIIQSGIINLVERHLKIAKVEKASTKDEILGRIQDQKFDFIITDLFFGGKPVIEDLKYISQLHNDINIIVYTDLANEVVIDEASRRYFSGVVLKNRNEKEIIDRIKQVVYTDKKYKFREGFVFLESDSLTERESEVLDLICKEHTTSDISELLFISPNTVESHRKKLFSKFGVRNVAGLVKKAFQLKLVS